VVTYSALKKRIFGPFFVEFCSPPPFVGCWRVRASSYTRISQIRIGRRERGKSDSNTPKIIHLGPEKSYLRTTLRNFRPPKSYSQTRKPEIFALKNHIFRTILGWSFTGPLDPDVLPSRVLPSFDAHGGQAEQVGGPVASPHLMPLTFGG
jgi:hypothetical protein